MGSWRVDLIAPHLKYVPAVCALYTQAPGYLDTAKKNYGSYQFTYDNISFRIVRYL